MRFSSLLWSRLQIKEGRRLVTGVEERWVMGEKIPERSLRVTKIEITNRMQPAIGGIKGLVFHAELELGARIRPQEEINRLIRSQIFAEVSHHRKEMPLIRRRRGGRRFQGGLGRNRRGEGSSPHKA